MKISSPEISFDNRLLAIEELFRQRKYAVAVKELANLNKSEFTSKIHELGLFLSLQAGSCYYQGAYKDAIEHGLKSVRLLADFPLNKRYGRVQLVLSKSYSAVGDLKNAEIRARDALAAYRRALDKVGQVDALNELARISYIRCSYHEAVAFLEDAIDMVRDNPRKLTQLTGNLGTLRVHVGQWSQAERDLEYALESNKKLGFDTAQVANQIAFGMLYMRLRRFVEARRYFDAALAKAEELDLKRNKVITLKYSGELAYERGDMFKAKALLSSAYRTGLALAP